MTGMHSRQYLLDYIIGQFDILPNTVMIAINRKLDEKYNTTVMSGH